MRLIRWCFDRRALCIGLMYLPSHNQWSLVPFPGIRILFTPQCPGVKWWAENVCVHANVQHPADVAALHELVQRRVYIKLLRQAIIQARHGNPAAMVYARNTLATLARHMPHTNYIIDTTSHAADILETEYNQDAYKELHKDDCTTT